MLRSYKDSKYLVFEFEDGKNVKFDLSNGEFIGKSGRHVKSLNSQFKGFSIDQVINSFEDENYKKFLNHVKRITMKETCSGGYSYSSLGTFFKYVRQNLHLEQFFASNFTNVPLDQLRFTMSDIPKGLLKISKKKNIMITERILGRYIDNPNLWNNLLQYEFEMFDVVKMVNETYFITDKFCELIQQYNYNVKSLCQYVDNIMRFEGVDEQAIVIETLYDYTRMCSIIGSKFDKYPKYLSTIHDITSRNYNRLVRKFQENVFQEKIKKDMEFTFRNWVFIYPKSTDEIKDEAVQQSNCVASYIDSVLEDKCDILFMRNKDDLQKSVVTIEVRDNKVVQAKGRFNRDCTKVESMVIGKYEEFLRSRSLISA